VFVLFCNPLFNYQTEPTDIRNPVLQAVCNTLYVTWIYIYCITCVTHAFATFDYFWKKSQWLASYQDCTCAHYNQLRNTVRAGRRHATEQF